MFPLIEITTVPIEIKVTTRHAQMEYRRGTAEMEVSRDDQGGLNIKSRPIRLQMDSFESKGSTRPVTVRNAEQTAGKGKQAAYEATATYADHGKLLLEAKVGQDLTGQLARESVEQDLRTQTVQIQPPELPEVPEPPSLQWEGGDLQIRYEMDKLNFDWKVDKGEFKFTPGDIEISVEQQPDVIIRYVGGPIYVPPSADPNYEPVDVRV